MARKIKGFKLQAPIKLRNFFPILLIVIAAWATFNGLNSFVSTSPYFRIDKIEIRLIGRVPLSPDTVKRLLNIHKGRGIFDVDLAGTRDYILLNFPEVRTLVINRVFPNKLVLTIRPRRPVAQIGLSSGFCLVDGEAVVLPGIRGLAMENLPIIAGVDSRSVLAMTGKSYAHLGLKKALRLLEVANQMRFQEGHQIHMIDVSDEKNLSLYIEGGIEIKIGSEDFRDRLSMLLETFETGRLDKSRIKYIDLRFGNVIIGPK